MFSFNRQKAESMKRVSPVIVAAAMILAGSLRGAGFATLKWAGGARAAGMGMAFTARADDGTASFWNPAGLDRLDGVRAVISLHRWFSDVQSEFFSIGWSRKRHGFGAHVLYTRVGDIELRETATLEPLAVFSAYELAIGFSYSLRVSSALSFGLTVKTLYEKIDVDDVWGLAADAGLLWVWGTDGLRLGWVLQNMGRTGRFNRERIELPLISRLGAAIPFRAIGAQWLAAVEGVAEKDAPFHVHAGFEVFWDSGLILRCGYQTGYQTRNVSGGIGFRWSRYRLDYNYTPTRWGLGDSHQMGMEFVL